MAGGHLAILDQDLSTTGGAASRFTPTQVVEYGANRYVFWIDSAQDLVYRKSTDRGRTWGAAVVIHAATYSRLTCWFDRWTPGDSGTTVHIWGIDEGADDVNYFSLDVSSDTLGNSGTAIVVFDGATASTNANIAGAKARGGNLLCVFTIDGGTEKGTYRSTNSGATWASRTDTFEAAADYVLLFPGNEADNQDFWAVYLHLPRHWERFRVR
jgi:hypothetical protein